MYISISKHVMYSCIQYSSQKCVCAYMYIHTFILHVCIYASICAAIFP